MLAFPDFRMYQLLWFLVAVLFLFQTGTSLATEKDTPQGEKFSDVDFKDGLLKVSVEKQSFKEVMAIVAIKTGIKVVIDNPTDDELTMSFDYLPLEKGLKKLLRGKNYAFKRSWGDLPSGRLTHVMVFGMTEGISVAMVEEKEWITKLDQQHRLDELLEGISMNGDDLRIQIDKAMKKIREVGISKEIKMVKGEVEKDFPLGKVNMLEKTNTAFENIASEETKTVNGGMEKNYLLDEVNKMNILEKINMALEEIQEEQG